MNSNIILSLILGIRVFNWWSWRFRPVVGFDFPLGPEWLSHFLKKTQWDKGIRWKPCWWLI